MSTVAEVLITIVQSNQCLQVGYLSLPANVHQLIAFIRRRATQWLPIGEEDKDTDIRSARSGTGQSLSSHGAEWRQSVVGCAPGHLVHSPPRTTVRWLVSGCLFVRTPALSCYCAGHWLASITINLTAPCTANSCMSATMSSLANRPRANLVALTDGGSFEPWRSVPLLLRLLINALTAVRQWLPRA